VRRRERDREGERDLDGEVGIGMRGQENIILRSDLNTSQVKRGVPRLDHT
jgi:hypothetical protein